MRIGAVLTGAFIVLGCQGNKEVSNSAAPGAAAEAPETAPAAEPEAAAEPQAAIEDSIESEAPSDGPVYNAELVAQVKGLLQIKTVAGTETGVHVVFVLEQAVTVNDQSTPQEVSDAMMFATFYAAPLLYARLADLDGLQQAFRYKSKVIGNVHMTRASYQSLNYDEAMQGATDKKAKQSIYRKLLSQLPEGAVQIDKKYR
ncbi:MAG: hypothetical protein JRF54_00225 [Deltaproteobacteria bacterium]|nr:hypothetical protein [Deltaproteobacteria bacterium]MBW2545648.1 hypothetical protein [Deltaproteobacteria bacterium]MBW2717650.1 hypothetical protein [Deltaproteobacteria bacterium]